MIEYLEGVAFDQPPDQAERHHKHKQRCDGEGERKTGNHSVGLYLFPPPSIELSTL